MLGSLPEPRRATYRTFRSTVGKPVDQGVALYFPAPTSFTGESVLELHGHGGEVVINQLVDAAISLGARHANPGEFSQRAFLNNKLDLSQAEAVSDLINANTEQAARAALRSLSGEFSRTVNELAEQLVRVRLYVEAAIDFPEEEVDFLSDDALQRKLEECTRAFAALLEKTQQGRVLRDGFRVVIVGKPNAGKSSLLNRLSGEDSAIVTDIAGTTRDVLRERINIDGLAVELIDTAGLRENPDRVEEEGIRRARLAMQTADAVLWLQDATDPDPQVLDESLPDGVPVTVIRNKVDLRNDSNSETLGISAKTGSGIDALRQQIRTLAGYENLGRWSRNRTQAPRRGHSTSATAFCNRAHCTRRIARW